MATPGASDDEVRAAAQGVLETTGTRRADEAADDGSVEAVAARTGLKVVEPLRPELAPGESVMTVPDRFCTKCNEARGGRVCGVCRKPTVARLAEGEAAEEYTPPELVRPSRSIRTPKFRAAAKPELDELEELDDDQGDEGDDDDAPPAPVTRSVRAPRLRPEPVREVELEREAATNEMAELRAQLRSMRAELVQYATAASGFSLNAARRQQGEPMAPRQQQARMGRRREMPATDHEFETVSRQQGRTGRRGQVSVDARMAQQWDEATINLPAWIAFYQALLHGCTTIEDVERQAELADEAYVQLMVRQHPQ
jgi:hypothetical protein